MKRLAVAVEAPERWERGGVDGERARPVGGPCPAVGRLTRRRQVLQIVGQQVELLVRLEADPLEAEPLAFGEGAGQGPLEPAVLEDLAGVLHHRGGRRDGVADGGDVRDAIITPPRPDSQALVAPTHDLRPHRFRGYGRRARLRRQGRRAARRDRALP